MRLFFRKYGSGPPLIILHGLYGSSENWISIAKMVSSSCTVYLPDLRNHGQSPHSEIMNYDAMSDDLEEMAEETGITRFFLAGHSMGGKVAMTYAIRNPEKLNGLLVADISPFTDEQSEKEAFTIHSNILDAMQSLDLQSIRSRTEAEAGLIKMIRQERIVSFIMKNLQRNDDKGFSWKINVPVLRMNLHRIIEGLDRSRTDDIQISGFPVIFLKASDSDYIKPEYYPDILRLFPSAEIKEIPQAGHWLHSDQPGLVVRSILDLAGHP